MWNLIGSAHDDILAGDRRDNDIDRRGQHTLYGGPGGGDDVMAGGLGMTGCSAGRATIPSPAGRVMTLAGGPGNDVFVFGPEGRTP